MFPCYRANRIQCKDDVECLNFGLVHDFRVLIVYWQESSSFQINDNNENLRPTFFSHLFVLQSIKLRFFNAIATTCSRINGILRLNLTVSRSFTLLAFFLMANPMDGCFLLHPGVWCETSHFTLSHNLMRMMCSLVNNQIEPEHFSNDLAIWVCLMPKNGMVASLSNASSTYFKWEYGWAQPLTSELVKQFCGSSRFLRRFRGANSVCGESCGGGGIADASWNNIGGDFDASPSDCWSFCVSSCCVNDCDSVSKNIWKSQLWDPGFKQSICISILLIKCRIFYADFESTEDICN